MIQVREADLDDLEVVLELWSEFTQYLSKMEPDFFQLQEDAREIYRQILHEQLQSEHTLVLLAKDSAKAIGYNLTSIRYPTNVFLQIPYGHISDLYLRQEFRGQKVGQQLVKIAIVWLKNRGISKVNVNPFFTSSQVVKFWKDMGFERYEMGFKSSIEC